MSGAKTKFHLKTQRSVNRLYRKKQTPLSDSSLPQELGCRLQAIVAALALCLFGGEVAQAAPVFHSITFYPNSISDTPFGLTSLPAPFTASFVVDDSILQIGVPEIVDALPGFSLVAPIVIGDASFSNSNIAVAPGGRVVDGKLVEIYFLAQLVDPVEGQRRFETYFFPALQWTGTDFNPQPPSEFLGGTYTITLIPEPSVMLLGLSFGLLTVSSRTRGKHP